MVEIKAKQLIKAEVKLKQSIKADVVEKKSIKANITIGDSNRYYEVANEEGTTIIVE